MAENEIDGWKSNAGAFAIAAFGIKDFAALLLAQALKRGEFTDSDLEQIRALG